MLSEACVAVTWKMDFLRGNVSYGRSRGNIYGLMRYSRLRAWTGSLR